MLSGEELEHFLKRLALTRAVAGAAAASILVCVGLAAVLGVGGPTTPAAEALRGVFYLLAAGLIGTAVFLRRRLFSDERLRRSAGGGLPALMTAVQTGQVVLCASWEGLAVLGLVLAILSRSAADLWPFAGASALGLYSCWPRRRDWEERAERALRSAFRE